MVKQYDIICLKKERKRERITDRVKNHRGSRESFWPAHHVAVIWHFLCAKQFTNITAETSENSFQVGKLDLPPL